MGMQDFQERAGAYLSTPPPTDELARIAPTQQEFQQNQQVQKESVGFWDSIFMGRDQRKYLIDSGAVQDNIGQSILREFVQPVANLGQDLAQWALKGDREEMRVDVAALNEPPSAEEQERIATALADLDRLEADGRVTSEQAAEMRQTLNASSAPFISDEQAEEYQRIIGEQPNAKEVAGDVAGTALTAVSFFPAVGAVRAVQASRGIKAAQGIKASTTAARLSRLSPFLRAGIENGGLVAGFSAAQKASDDADLEEIAKAGGVGFVEGLAFSMAAFGAGKVANSTVQGLRDLTLRGANKLAGNQTFQKAFQVAAESTPVEYIKRIFGSVQSNLERNFGDIGSDIVNRAKTADRDSQLRIGQYLVAAQDATKALNDGGRELAYEISHVLRGTNRKATQELPEEVVKFFRDAFDDLAGEVSSVGAKIRVPAMNGKPSFWQKFQAVENYMPQVTVDWKQVRQAGRFNKEGRLRQWVLRNAVDSGHFSTLDDAVKALDGWVELAKSGRLGENRQNAFLEYLVSSKQAENIDEAWKLFTQHQQDESLVKLGGSIERARVFDNPFYNPFPDEVFPLYLQDTMTRVNTIKQFGVEYLGDGAIAPRLEDARNQMKRIVNEEALDINPKQIDRWLNIVMEQIDNGTWQNKVAHFMTASSVPLLTFAQIVNVGQAFLNPLLKSDIRAVGIGLTRAMTREGWQDALRAGATTQTVFNGMVKQTAGGSNFADTWLKMTGFTWTERFNRTVAANAGVDWVKRNFTKFVETGDNVYGQRLRELGIDTARIAQEGLQELADDDLLRAAQVFSEKTQFRSRPMELPAFTSSPAGKVFWQFKNFAYQQLDFVMKETIGEFRNGNVSRGARNLLLLATVFPMTGEVLQDIRSLITQSRRPTKALDRYISNLASAGSIGIFADLIDSARFDRAEELIAGPSVGRVLDAINITDDPDKWLDEAMRATGFLTPLRNTMKDRRPGTRSTLEEIDRLLNR